MLVLSFSLCPASHHIYRTVRPAECKSSSRLCFPLTPLKWMLLFSLVCRY